MSTRLFPIPGAKIRDGVRIGFPPAGTVGLFVVENMDAETPGELVLFAGYPDGTQVAVGGQVVFPPDQHTHIIDDVTGLQVALDAKADLVHAHEIEDVNGLEAALAAAGGETTLTGTLAHKIWFARKAEVFARILSASVVYGGGVGRAAFDMELVAAPLASVGGGTTSRYFRCTSPTSGTITGSNGPDVGATGTGIYIKPGQLIYYIPPWDAGSVNSVAANFRIVYTESDATSTFDVPPEWVLVCAGDYTKAWFPGGLYLNADPGVNVSSSYDGHKKNLEVLSGQDATFARVTATTGLRGTFDGVSDNIHVLTQSDPAGTINAFPFAAANVFTIAVVRALDLSATAWWNLDAGKANPFTLILSFDGAHAITWPASWKWLGAPPEVVGAAGRTDVVSGFTLDGGVTWHCSYAMGGFTA